MDLFELSAKIELDTGEYEKSVKDASEKAENLADSLKSSGKAADKAENAANNLGNELNKTAKSADKAENSMGDLKKDLRGIDQASDNAEKSVDDLGDTADQVADAVDSLGDRAEKAGKQTEKLGQGAENGGKGLFDSLVKADLFANAIGRAGDMAMEVVQYIWNLDEATEEYRASQAKLNTAFKVSGFNANTARDAFKGLYRAVGDIDQATEAAQLLSQLALTTEDISKWTEIATGVVGTFGDSLPIESLIESANETARVGKVTGTLADALNWAGQIGEDEFNAMLADCGSQAERVNLITETLVGTYEGAASTFEESSASIIKTREAYLEIQDAAAQTGQEVEKLKGTLLELNSVKLQGFFALTSQLVKTTNNIANAGSSASESHEQLVSDLEKKIQTGSIEEVTEAVEKLKGILEETSAFNFNDVFGGGASFGPNWLNVFQKMGERSQLTGLLAEGEAALAESSGLAATAAERLASASEHEVEAMEPIIATAGGVSVAIEGTGMTAEEASSQLQTYTDAATNMFDKISEKSELSYQDAIANLEANVQATENFSANMTSLAGALPPALAEMFYAGGPAMYAGTVAMLAEANKGADVGLEQLNQLWDQGGKAAVDAFIQSLGKVPEGTENPATITAAQMEQDTSMEAASVSAVSRAASSMSEAVSSAGFDASGRLAMQLFGSGMESMRSYVMSIARNIAQSAKNEINNALSDIGGGRGGGRAGGLDYVPYNGYPAVLHAGEAVLTAREAKDWRAGKSGISNGVTINQYITAVPQTPAQFAAATQAYFQEAVWAL